MKTYAAVAYFALVAISYSVAWGQVPPSTAIYWAGAIGTSNPGDCTGVGIPTYIPFGCAFYTTSLAKGALASAAISSVVVLPYTPDKAASVNALALATAGELKARAEVTSTDPTTIGASAHVYTMSIEHFPAPTPSSLCCEVFLDSVLRGNQTDFVPSPSGGNTSAQLTVGLYTNPVGVAWSPSNLGDPYAIYTVVVSGGEYVSNNSYEVALSPPFGPLKFDGTRLAHR